MSNIMDSYIQGINGMGNNQTANNEKEEITMNENQTTKNKKAVNTMGDNIDYNEVVTIGYREDGEPIRVTRGVLKADGMEYLLYGTPKKSRKKKAEDTKKSNNANKNKEVSATMNNETNNIKETEAMANEKAKNVDGAATNGETPLDNLGEIIPADEQAVAEEDGKKIHIAVVESIEPLKDATAEIPEDERAETEALPVRLEDITKCGLFAPILDMKGLITDTGHTFWAKTCMEPKTGRAIIYRQQYRDGTFSAQMKIDQADLVIAATYRFMPESIKDTIKKNAITKFIADANRDYYSKLIYPKEGLDILSILTLLITEYANLPFENNVPMLEQPEKLYPKVIQIIKDKHLDIIDEHKAYYTLNKDQIEILAEGLGVDKKVLLKKLKEYHFLYITESSKGYQTCVRFKPYGDFAPTSSTEWCYCILKLEYLAKKRLQKAEE